MNAPSTLGPLRALQQEMELARSEACEPICACERPIGSEMGEGKDGLKREPLACRCVDGRFLAALVDAGCDPQELGLSISIPGAGVSSALSARKARIGAALRVLVVTVTVVAARAARLLFPQIEPFAKEPLARVRTQDLAGFTAGVPFEAGEARVPLRAAVSMGGGGGGGGRGGRGGEGVRLLLGRRVVRVDARPRGEVVDARSSWCFESVPLERRPEHFECIRVFSVPVQSVRRGLWTDLVDVHPLPHLSQRLRADAQSHPA
ncbi:hypothetical protein DFH06DRAFT_1249629 [Mycena polygramma]|nr:hypothetical protein DFH06DRAFT_1249629 [Mycena polygramma]